jgi:prepilin-type N-terminal cleavage/methylation domain-containing protein
MNRYRKGFILIELLVVIVVIAILAAIALLHTEVFKIVHVMQVLRWQPINT